MSPFISVRFLQAQTDSRLLSLAAEGHDRAFEALVRRYRRQLLAYSFRLLNSSSRAEDAVQQGLLQAWIALQRGTEVRDAKSWFYRIVHNTALNMQRGSAQEYAQLCDASTMDASGPDIEAQIEIADVFTELAALPPMQRQALLRTSLEGESHDEVASALGLSAKAVRGLIYRARASMRAAVGALIPTPIVNWALTAGKPGIGAADRIGELVAGGGGLATIAVNSGVAVVAVGALATGAAVAPHRHAHVGGPARAHAAAATVLNGAGTDVASVSTANGGTTIRVSGAGPSPSASNLSLASVAAQGATGTTSLGVTRPSGASAQRRGGSDGRGGAGPHGDGGGSGSSSGDGGHSSGSGSDSPAGSGHSGSGGGDNSASSGGDTSRSGGSTSGDGANGSGTPVGSAGSAGSGGSGGSYGSDSHGGTASESHGSGSGGGGGGDGTGSSPSTVTAPAPATPSTPYGE